MDITLPQMLEQAWSRALPGREAAERNEALRMFFDELARPRATFGGNRVSCSPRDDKLSERRCAVGRRICAFAACIST
jgi:hypothetical protein